MPDNWNAIHLGTGPLIDLVEGNDLADNASALVGMTFGGPTNKLFADVTFITTINNGGVATTLEQNNNVASDQFQFNLNDGNGVQTTVFDAVATYNTTITYTDGTTFTGTIGIVQDSAGNLFLIPQTTNNALQAAFIAKPIESITLNSLVNASFVGITRNRLTTNFLACFRAGTLIATPEGDRPVEDLQVGDPVLTMDDGAQTLRWVGSATVSGQDAFAPIRIAAGTLGARRDVYVSPNHRILISGPLAELHFIAPEVLVAAKHLVNDLTIRPAPCDHVTYVHLLFDRHTLVQADGMWSESYFPGEAALDQAEASVRDEILALFPRLDDYRAARPMLTGREARVLRKAVIQARATPG